MMASTRDILSTAQSDAIDYVAVGSPHLSYEEAVTIGQCLGGRTVRLPFYANTGRHVVQRLEREGRLKPLVDAGIQFIVDTCIVVTPIVPSSGTLMTNSGKFACYVPGTTGCEVMFGSTAECVESAVAGRLVRDMDLWS
jgi:predicted aconitase